MKSLGEDDGGGGQPAAQAPLDRDAVQAFAARSVQIIFDLEDRTLAAEARVEELAAAVSEKERVIVELEKSVNSLRKTADIAQSDADFARKGFDESERVGKEKDLVIARQRSVINAIHEDSRLDKLSEVETGLGRL